MEETNFIKQGEIKINDYFTLPLFDLLSNSERDKNLKNILKIAVIFLSSLMN
jgi:hypothetical protein